MVVAFAVITGVVALIDWWSVWRGRPDVEAVAKPLTMVGLIAVAESAGAGDHATGIWLLVALFLGMLGDVALLGNTQQRFLGGVGAFFAGHLAYVVCFARLFAPTPWLPWLAGFLLAVVLVATRDTVPAAFRLGGARVAVPVAAYSLVIGVMLITASLTGRPLIAAGAAIFVVSDSMIGVSLAKKGYGGPAGPAHVAVMVTYHLGQALMVVGVLHALAT